MVQLNREAGGGSFTGLPERILQFGEGGFLRAFVDWMIHEMNQKELFKGQVVVVQPIAEGMAGIINEQDGLFTLLLRGLQEGKPVEETAIISSISRGLNPYTQWGEVLRCAEDPAMEFVVSNTTEAGIAYDSTDHPEMTPPGSFPAKLAVYLYHRFTHFSGDPARGIVILPCELIDRNGDNLKAIIIRMAQEWGWSSEFTDWIEKHNYFLNTLVDRVVTGYPRDEVVELTARLGYEDKLLNTGELFHLWVIEGPVQLAEKLPFAKAGLNVVWTEDMTPYRTRKVRVLNGAHTATVPAAFLYGLETVGEMMNHEVMGAFVRQTISEEIVPSIKLDHTMLTEYADAVVERFCNPFIKHYLVSILLNSSSKFKTRVLPSLLEYVQEFGRLPERLVFSLAALIAVYQAGTMKDDEWVLDFFAGVWANYDGTAASASAAAEEVLSQSRLWGQDLTLIPGLKEMVASQLQIIQQEGMQAALQRLVRR